MNALKVLIPNALIKANKPYSEGLSRKLVPLRNSSCVDERFGNTPVSPCSETCVFSPTEWRYVELRREQSA